MKLTIIGGGGFRVPQVYQAVAAQDAPVRLDEVALYDVDVGRLDVIHRIITELAQQLPHAPRLTVTTDLDEALTGADFIFAAVRIGGLRGRIGDERVALDLGVLGQETTGPGGLAYALRTVPVMTALAHRIAQLAPEAWTINFTNPAGIVTEAMRKVLGDKVVGICDTPIGLMRRTSAAVAAASGSPLETVQPGSFDYVGLNHLGWLRSVAVEGIDLLPTLLADDSLLDGIEEARLMGHDWVRALGALPNEYLYYYYFTREATAKIRAAEHTRGEFLQQEQSAFYAEVGHAGCGSLQTWLDVQHRRESSYMAESRPDGAAGARRMDDVQGGYQQVALDLMAAIANDRPATMILNIANDGLVPQLPDEAVIEVGCVVTAEGVKPWPIAPVTGHMLGLMASVKAVEQLTIEAALTRSSELAWKAFALHPLVDSIAVGRALLDGYRQVHPGLARALD
ncbi:6-phospho-beta-glucosidase [Nakamurella sp. A5-74]|uniref:6-phospho-beta-glucosidase n=1 Tax=Nakamurella sp. A5-74 TaxID=3158264 RepID=A0AAU8DPM6_9ACTN